MGGLALAPTFATEEDVLGDQVPINDPNHFKFVTSSCVKPDFPYSPASFPVWNWALQLLRPSSSSSSSGDAHADTFARRNVVKGFDLMYDRYIRGKDQPNVRFFLQLGDLIYADVPKRFSTAVVQGYRKLYRNLFASASFRRVFERIPMIGIYDDHEVKNNWAGLTTEGKVIEEFPPANTAWQEYVGRANPDSLEEGEHHFTFRYGSETAFFVFDTRRHREPSTGFSEEEEEEAAENNYHHIDGQPFKTMLGQRQKEQFIQWLGAVNSTATFKFVVSSVPFMSLWGGAIDIDGKKDSWAAYLEEREELLDIMQYVKGSVIVLSGDRHEFASTGLRSLDYPHPDSHPITEFSTSPLSMFYLPVRTLSQSHGRGPTGQEKLLKYIPDGNYKWTDFEVDTRDPSHPHVIARVFVDGEMAWKVKLLGRSVREGQARTVGGLAKSFLELLGWKSRKWF